jgi:cytochrome c-type biogenesis protein CcmH/NrfG
MAQTRKRRRRKHRGTQSGSVDRRRRSRPRTREEARAQARRQSGTRRDKPPTWQSALNRALLMAGILFLLLVVAFGREVMPSLFLAVTMLVFYVPAGYYLERFLYNRRRAAEQRAREQRAQQR